MLAAAMTSAPTHRVGSFGSFVVRDRAGTATSRRVRKIDLPSPPRRPLVLERATIAPVTPLILLVAGFIVLVAGVLILWSFGGAYRIGRLLATTPLVTIAEANALARAARPPYVRVEGRLDSDAVFRDEADRPLVFRRARLQQRRGGRA